MKSLDIRSRTSSTEDLKLTKRARYESWQHPIFAMSCPDPRSDSMGPSLNYRWGKSFRSKFRRSSDAQAASPGSGVSWASKRQLWLRRDRSQSLFSVDGEGQFHQLNAGQYWKVSKITIFTLMWILVFRKQYRQVAQQPEHKSGQKGRILHWYRGVSISLSLCVLGAHAYYIFYFEQQ